MLELKITRDKVTKLLMKMILPCPKMGERNACSFRSPWVTLPLNLFFPTHFVLFPSAMIYPKPLYKSLHPSFFYSFITILPSQSGVTLLGKSMSYVPPFWTRYTTSYFFLMIICNSLLLLKSLPINIVDGTVCLAEYA
jgi:hypothetical protein